MNSDFKDISDNEANSNIEVNSDTEVHKVNFDNQVSDTCQGSSDNKVSDRCQGSSNNEVSPDTEASIYNIYIFSKLEFFYPTLLFMNKLPSKYRSREYYYIFISSPNI